MSTIEATNNIKSELERRLRIWASLQKMGGPAGISKSLIRELGLYGGAQGIWVDKERTRGLTKDGSGITVGLLHTGQHYDDDLAEDCILYHYPETHRKGHDQTEIKATKNAGKSGLPVFVITPGRTHATRNVHFGWVEDWDDDSNVFLVTFEEKLPVAVVPGGIDDEPFNLVEESKGKQSQVKLRQGQQRFKFLVFKRYGPRCAVCGIGVLEVLDAVHIRPKAKRGSDDPRNGLVLCASHHRAFDAHLFCIDPTSLRIMYQESGPHSVALGITYQDLKHSKSTPHKEALQWRRSNWRGNR